MFKNNNKGLAVKLEENHASVSPRTSPALEDMIEEVPDTDDQPNANENGYVFGEDAASETGTDDSGLVMALDQESSGHREENQSNNAIPNVVVKTSERTRSTISEDKAAVGYRSSYSPFYFTT